MKLIVLTIHPDGSQTVEEREVDAGYFVGDAKKEEK